MVLTFFALFIGISLVWHWFSFDRAEVSTRAAILLGIGCAAFAWVQQSWQVGVLVFFLAAFCEFAAAYLIGLSYSSFASGARSDYMDDLKSANPSERRGMIGAIGAIAIPLGAFAAWLAGSLQTGIWELPSAKPLLGFCAFLVLGVAAAVQIFRHRRNRKVKRDAPT